MNETDSACCWQWRLLRIKYQGCSQVSLVVKVKSITLTETSLQCVINSEEGQAGIADTWVMFLFYFFVIRGGICPWRHCRRQCNIFASGVNFSIFTHFLCFFLLKLLKLGEIDSVKFLAWKSGGVIFLTNSMSECSHQDSSWIPFKCSQCFFKFLYSTSFENFVLHTQVGSQRQFARTLNKLCYDPTFACLLTLRRGGWWGRERPSRSRGSPWWSQGGEGSAGPGGLLKTDLLKMIRLDLSSILSEKIPWSQCNLLKW